MPNGRYFWLQPFPPRFVSEYGPNINSLVLVINDTPNLRVVLQNITDENFDEIDMEVVGSPQLRLVDDEGIKRIMRYKMQIDDAKHSHVFEVVYSVLSNIFIKKLFADVS